MRALALALVLAAAALAAVPAASAANECRGLEVCVSIRGPWVAIPAERGRAPAAYVLACPKGYFAGGVDARLAEPAIDVAFLGRPGSPVAGGTTTAREVVFLGWYTGVATRATSYRPFLGCAPSTGGGGRSSTGRAQQEPGYPAAPSTKRRVRNVRLKLGAAVTLAHGCARSERLVSAEHAVAFWTKTPPGQALLRSVRTTGTLRDARLEVGADARSLPPGVRVEVQLQAVCAPKVPR